MDTTVAERMMRYVRCASISGNEAAFYQILVDELTTLGFAVSPCLRAEGGLPTPNLYASLPGQGEPLLFSAHMDTVSHDGEIEPYIENGVMRARGNSILGADDKSGIAAIMEATARVVHANKAHIPIELLFTVGEEAGLAGAKAADYSLIKSKWAYVFDSSAPFGGIVVCSPQIRQYHLSIRGRAAHAAIHPEQGVNALVVAAKIIAAVDWGRAGEANTMNAGNFKAEGATNVICDYAEFEAETRSFEPDGAVALGESIREKAREVCLKHGAELTFEERLQIPGFSLGTDVPSLAPLLRAFARHGVTPSFVTSYGGSDANFFNANGISSVDISTGMRQSHSPNESILVDELEKITDVIAEIMQHTPHDGAHDT